jgi:hypothetical protein
MPLRSCITTATMPRLLLRRDERIEAHGDGTTVHGHGGQLVAAAAGNEVILAALGQRQSRVDGGGENQIAVLDFNLHVCYAPVME